MSHDPYNPPPAGFGAPPGGYGAPPGGFGGPPPLGYPPPYPPPGMYGGYGPQQPYEDVNTTLPIVLNAICLSLCCMPAGVAGIVLAMQASSAKNMGDFDRARTKARGATVLALVTMGACSVIYALIFIASLLGG